MRPMTRGLVIRKARRQLHIRLPSGLVVKWPDTGKHEFGDRVMVLYDRNEDKVVRVEAPETHVEALLDDASDPPEESGLEYEPPDIYIDES